ncbi:MAG: hypothetical protein GXO66_07870 [Euryarchaeota archaeon]|nr:hypothetical protein [Euryarchaeota archaeon]
MRCPKCGSSNVEKGHQEVFPSTFMKDTKYSVIKALTSSKEFEIYACMDCGYAEWYIQEKYLEGGNRVAAVAKSKA